MKTIELSIDSVGYKKELASKILELGAITSGGANFSSGPLVFLDTNILLWLYRINEDARREIFSLFNKLKEVNRLFIPVWVVQEYNNHLTQLKPDVFFPFKRPAKELKSRLSEIEKYSKLIIDNTSLQGSSYETRDDFLAQFEKASSVIEKSLQALSKAGNMNIQHIKAEIDTLMRGIILDSDVLLHLKSAHHYGDARSHNRIPPGYMDQEKESNSHGDYILWKEVIHKCKEHDRSAVIITNDTKKDWVYTPQKVFRYHGFGVLNRKKVDISNDGKKEIKMSLPHPFLEYEFKLEVGKKSQLHILNIEMLSHLVSSSDYNPQNSSDFLNLAEATSVDCHTSDTSLVISWFLNNKDMYKHAVNTVAYWGGSPSDMNLEALKEFVDTSVPDINIDNVEWGEIITELFL